MSTYTSLATAAELPTTSHITAEGTAWNAAFNDNNERNSTTATISSTEAAIINDKNQDSTYECSICLDTADNAVVSMCGHLFCWPCLHQWLETRPSPKLCPVCKAAIGEDKVIPLYGRDSTKQEDPRNKIPPRPAGQRTEPEAQPQQEEFQGLIFGSFRIPFGFGSFIALFVYIIIITIYSVWVTLRFSRPKCKDVLHSNKNPKICTKFYFVEVNL